MNQEVINKINEEVIKNKNNTAFVRIADYLKFKVAGDEKAAAKYLGKNGSIQHCYDDIRSMARKESSGNACCVEDEKVFGWAKEFYGLTNAAESDGIDIDKLLE